MPIIRTMNTLREIESAVSQLRDEDLAEFRQWYAEFDAAAWDAEIERDALTGRLDPIAEEALAAFRAGKCTPL